MKIKDLPKIDMPRERLSKYGPHKLNDYELLAILLGSGVYGHNVVELSKKILKIIQAKGTEEMTVKDLLDIKGLGKVKALQIISILELAKRFTKDAPEILSARDVWKLCIDFRRSKKEHFVVFYLDTQNRLIERQIISIGTLNASLVHPREVFEPALPLHAASIILSHNHPSGKTEPSMEDKDVTRRLVQAGKILGIEIADHIIVAEKNFLSFEQRGLL